MRRSPGLEELRESADYVQRRERAMRRIRRARKKVMPRIVEAYEGLRNWPGNGYLFGLENREGLEEMPLDAEFPEFLGERLPDPAVFGYWHDTGHAQLKHLAGLLDHRKHLESMADRLIGFHLHDVSHGGRDHRVPGTGLVDFKMIAEFVRPEHALVLELSPSSRRMRCCDRAIIWRQCWRLETTCLFFAGDSFVI